MLNYKSLVFLLLLQVVSIKSQATLRMAMVFCGYQLYSGLRWNGGCCFPPQRPPNCGICRMELWVKLLGGRNIREEDLHLHSYNVYSQDYIVPCLSEREFNKNRQFDLTLSIYYNDGTGFSGLIDSYYPANFGTRLDIDYNGTDSITHIIRHYGHIQITDTSRDPSMRNFVLVLNSLSWLANEPLKNGCCADWINCGMCEGYMQIFSENTAVSLPYPFKDNNQNPYVTKIPVQELMNDAFYKPNVVIGIRFFTNESQPIDTITVQATNYSQNTNYNLRLTGDSGFLSIDIDLQYYCRNYFGPNCFSSCPLRSDRVDCNPETGEEFCNFGQVDPPKCEEPPNGCSSNSCFNNGTCVTDKELNNFRCVCPPGYNGRNCQFTFCSIACDHGNCVGPNTCQCDDGYTGGICSEATCDDYFFCFNLGRCLVENNRHRCLCDRNIFGGTQCQVTCIPQCQHGTCVDYYGVGRCVCDRDYFGVGCDISAEDIQTPAPIRDNSSRPFTIGIIVSCVVVILITLFLSVVIIFSKRDFSKELMEIINQNPVPDLGQSVQGATLNLR